MQRPFAAYTGSEPYVFVSYAHDDAATVYPELERLTRLGLNVWYDEGITPGAEWSEELANRIAGAGGFIYFVNPASVASRNCRSEVQYAQKLGKRLLAVHLEPTELPGALDLSLGLDQAILRYQLTDAAYEAKLATALGATAPRPAPEPVTPGTRKRSTAWILAGVASVALLAVFWPAQRDAPLTTTPTIAVLPFKNLSDDPTQEYFSDGVSEDILNGLAKQPGLIVRARASSFSLRDKDLSSNEIAGLLEVSHLIDGSVRRDGNRIRVTAQLISVSDDRQLWSESYDGILENVFAVQDEITAQTLDALSVQLLGTTDVTPHSPPLAAYDSYLRGRHLYGRGELEPALAELRQAVDVDPDYADAWASLAQIEDLRAWYNIAPPGPRGALARGYVERALALEPNQPIALSVRALNLAFDEHDFQAAIDEFNQLIRRFPNDAQIASYYGLLMTVLAEHDAAIRLAERAAALDPLSGVRADALGATLRIAGRSEEARAAHARAQALGYPAAAGLAWIDLTQGDFDSAESLVALGDQAWGPNYQERALVQGRMAALGGDRNAAEPAVEHLREHPGPYMRLVVALIRNDLDAAFANFERGLAERDRTTLFLVRGTEDSRRLSPEFYADPRYAAILAGLALDSASLAQLRIPPLPDWD